MKRSHAAKDILDAVQACFLVELGQARCLEYRFARTRGIPPADCNSVTVSWMDRGVSQFADCAQLGSDCGEWDATHGLRIVITNICMGPDQTPDFPWDLEDAAAACFMDDLDLLEECVQCMDWSQIRADHSLAEMRYEGTTLDIETDGGGYSAYIELTLVAAECCSLTPPGP